MSTSWYGTLDLPTRMDPDHVLSTFREAADLPERTTPILVDAPRGERDEVRK